MVYVVNDMNHSFDKAERYGELTYVTTGKVPLFKTDVVRRMIRDGLSGFKSSDYLLVSGPAFMCMMAVLEVSNRLPVDECTIKVLVFDAKEQDYVVRHLLV